MFASKPTATVDSVTAGIDAVQAQIDELKAAVEVLKAPPAKSEVVPVQGGGSRRSKKIRRTMKNRRRK